MNNISKFIIVISLLITSPKLYSQNKLNIDFSSQYLFSSKENLQPFYQYTNKWGIVNTFEQSQAFFQSRTKYTAIDKKNIRVETGITGIIKNNINDSFLHEIYINAKLLNFINISIGKHAYSPISYDDDLTTGGFMRNANSRPIPRAQIGIFNYQPISFLGDIIEVKGGLSHGLLNDDRTASGKYNSADDIQVHEKWAYIRLGGDKKMKPYIGLFHAALLGGKRANGTEIAVDYWATFLGSGSAKLGGGEETNAAGAHDGFWDFGIDCKTNSANIHLYLQKPYADKTGLMLYTLRNKDYKIGVIAEIKHTKLIKKLSFELIKTDVQSGYGLPDPLYPGTYTIIWLRDDVKEYDNDYDAFMLAIFDEYTSGYDYYDTKEYLEDNLNNGLRYGERDDYNNNGTYYNAWTYQGMAMGLPLYHTTSQAKAYAPEWEPNDDVVFLNNRIRGFHIGIEGEPIIGLNYLLKATYTKNFGSYNEEFIYRYSWEEDDDFYYKEGKKQFYTNLNLSYKKSNWKYLTLNTNINYDTGELYEAFGMIFSASIKL